MVLLQEHRANQEQARLDALRQRDSERAQRFMNAKSRSIGIDKGALDRQLEEKERFRRAEEAEKRADAENLKALVRCLDSCEAAAQEEKRRSLAEVKRTLDEQRKLPRNNALKDGHVDLEGCGPASLQRFSGEDHAHEARKKAQQEQVKLWAAEYVVEKKRALDAERRQEEEYAHYVLEQDRIRSELEEASQRRRGEEARRRQLENLENARRARVLKEQELAAENEAQRLQSHFLQTCPLLTEDTKLATNANAEHRYRPDHFKGFQRDQVRKVYQENDAVLKEKRELCDRQANEEAEWAQYHASVLDKMRDAEDARQRMIDQENLIQRQILAQQKADLESRREKMEAERLQEIGPEFFTRFGQSCR
ncbi:hypothetical protein ACHAXT_009873 [Thalassiosira profunda]